MPAKLSMVGKMVVPVGLGAKVGVGGMGVFVGNGVFVGKGVSVGEGVDVGKVVNAGRGVDVGRTGIEAGAHPLVKRSRNTNASTLDPIDFFMAQTFWSGCCQTELAFAILRPISCAGLFVPIILTSSTQTAAFPITCILRRVVVAAITNAGKAGPSSSPAIEAN
jgi:hypothetical protein